MGRMDPHLGVDALFGIDHYFLAWDLTSIADERFAPPVAWMAPII